MTIVGLSLLTLTVPTRCGPTPLDSGSGPWKKLAGTGGAAQIGEDTAARAERAANWLTGFTSDSARRQLAWHPAARTPSPRSDRTLASGTGKRDCRAMSARGAAADSSGLTETTTAKPKRSP